MDEETVKKIVADAVKDAISGLPDKNAMEDLLLKLEVKINQIILGEVKKATDPLVAKIEKLELKHAVYEAHFSDIEQRLNEAERRIDDAEQYSRRSCLRIYGIPLASSSESAAVCLNKVKGVFKEIEVAVPDEAIDRAHRIGKKGTISQTGETGQAMIVKFASWRHRTAVFRGRKRLQDMSNERELKNSIHSCNMPKYSDDYTSRKHQMSLSKLQSPLTTKWLHENYEISSGVSLPRSSLYSHYLDFCQKSSLEPVNAASFGKVIRNTFPSLKTRRLGTRGQSKYHYYGICVKESSPYHDSVCSTTRQNAPGFNQTYNKPTADESVQVFPTKAQGQASQLTTVSNGVLLPDFPKADSIGIKDAKTKDKVKTFLIMYRAHCQRILDTILRANFSEVQHFLLHFWRGMPQHIAVILDIKEVIELIANCDNILYKAVSGVLIPGTLQPLPASLTQAIRQFAKQLCSWLENSLRHVPESLSDRKLAVAKAFCQILCRQTSLSHLAQAARTVLHSTDPVSQMTEDLRDIRITSIIEQTLWMTSKKPEKDFEKIYSFFQEFADLLEQQATVDQYTEWVASLVNRCVIKPSEKEEKSFQSCAQTFLLIWSFICSKFVQELTLRSAKSFGSFHLLQMLFDDYIFYLIESHAIVSEDSEDGLCEFSIIRNRSSDNTDFGMFNDNLHSQLNQKSRILQKSSSSGRGSLPGEGQEERVLANIQSAMTLPCTFLPPMRGTHSVQFPYDNAHHQPDQVYNSYGHYGAREQGMTEDSGMTYYEDRSNPFSYKQQLEFAGQSFNGPFLTQELERLHMSYGTENLFDRNYFFQRELRT